MHKPLQTADNDIRNLTEKQDVPCRLCRESPACNSYCRLRQVYAKKINLMKDKFVSKSKSEQRKERKGQMGNLKFGAQRVSVR
jgi:hypothetical protein